MSDNNNNNNNYNELITEFQEIIDTLEGIAPSPDSIDADLSSDSQKPVQNRTIKAALDNKADKSQITSLAKVATSGSYKDLSNKLVISTDMTNETTNIEKVTSPKAVADYVRVQVAGATGVSVDKALSSTSTNPVQNKVIKAAIDTINTTLSNKADKSQVDSLVIPTVPEISTNIENDKNNISKTASPKAVADYITNSISGLATETYVDNSVSGLATETYVDNKNSFSKQITFSQPPILSSIIFNIKLTDANTTSTYRQLKTLPIGALFVIDATELPSSSTAGLWLCIRGTYILDGDETDCFYRIWSSNSNAAIGPVELP